MSIFVFPSKLRIRTKADVQSFLTECSGETYWTDGEMDYHFDNGKIGVRPQSERGNVFAPYVILTPEEAAKVVWRTRKDINGVLYSRSH